MMPGDREQCEFALRHMRDAAQIFYALATNVGHHQFVEFNGLLVKYIELCKNALAADVDFVMNGFDAFPYHDHDIKYINEKLDCIFSGLSFAPTGQLRAIIDAAVEVKNARFAYWRENNNANMGELMKRVELLCALFPDSGSHHAEKQTEN